MSEISKYEAYKKKLDGICNENDLVFRFVNNTYPITLTTALYLAWVSRCPCLSLQRTTT